MGRVISCVAALAMVSTPALAQTAQQQPAPLAPGHEAGMKKAELYVPSDRIFIGAAVVVVAASVAMILSHYDNPNHKKDVPKSSTGTH